MNEKLDRISKLPIEEFKVEIESLSLDELNELLSCLSDDESEKISLVKSRIAFLKKPVKEKLDDEINQGLSKSAKTSQSSQLKM